MDCPHCGGRVDRAAPLLLDPAFDDDLRCLVIDGQRRRVTPMRWRILTLLRQRFRRLVPLGFLAQASAGNPADGGNIDVARVQVCFLRRTLAGSPFAIATVYGDGYGLFRAGEVEVAAKSYTKNRGPRSIGRFRQYRLRSDIAAGALTGAVTPLGEHVDASQLDDLPRPRRANENN
jgi:hypothetical protein